jgi:RNA polymerase-binding transcription factor DksA
VGARLAEERAETERRIASLQREYDGVVEGARDSNIDDEHDPEGATIAFEREQLAALLEQARARLSEIEQAEHRLDAGTYGLCRQCGGPISDERLAARAAAQTCIECA